ncbi:MAG: HEAT repeat domain-containing protein [Gemmatimonadota bacterium]
MTDRSRSISQSAKPCPDDLTALVEALASEDGLIRRQARRCLVRQGDRAVAVLLKALKDDNKVMRTEAAEALLYIASPVAAPALVEALDDIEFGVRWLAAEALIALKCEGLAPLLEGISRHGKSLWFRRAAHHVLHDHYCDDWWEELSPVLAALDGREAEETAPVAAEEALKRISAGGD